MFLIHLCVSGNQHNERNVNEQTKGWRDRGWKDGLVDGSDLCKTMTSNSVQLVMSKGNHLSKAQHIALVINFLTIHSKYISEILQLEQKFAAYSFQALQNW